MDEGEYKMTTLRIQRGVPASGKSTDARNWVNESRNTRIRVNRDDIRTMLGCFPIGTPEQEQNVTEIEYAAMEAGLVAGKDVVNDATNLRSENVTKLLKLASKTGAEVEFKDFPIGLDAAVFRDDNRAFDGKPSVGRAVITRFFDKYIRDGYNLPAVPVLTDRQIADYPVYVPDPEGLLPHAIIVDIDGTLAHHGDRNPYDTTRYAEDTLDITVRNLAVSWYKSTDCFIILMSGRNVNDRGVTEKWLSDNGVHYNALYMRPSDQPKTNDAIIKNELFEKYIAGQYDVDFVLDDRDRVVEMWRAKGLKVLQVSEGAF